MESMESMESMERASSCLRMSQSSGVSEKCLCVSVCQCVRPLWLAILALLFAFSVSKLVLVSGFS